MVTRRKVMNEEETRRKKGGWWGGGKETHWGLEAGDGWDGYAAQGRGG